MDPNKQALPSDQAKQAKQVKSGGGFSVISDFQSMYSNKGKFKNQLDEIVAAMQSGGHPEREPKATKLIDAKSELVQEIITEPELEKKPELSGYIEKVEKATEDLTPVMDDYKNQVLLSSVNPKNVKVTLPLDETKIEEGLHHKAWEAIRWLAEWCMRQLKVMKTKEPKLSYDD